MHEMLGAALYCACLTSIGEVKQLFTYFLVQVS